MNIQIRAIGVLVVIAVTFLWGEWLVQRGPTQETLRMSLEEFLHTLGMV